MSKIICDVCGTMYPETAAQCPICGCAKPADADTVASDTVQEETSAAGSYTYVKGGRFSKKNVRKRNKENQNTQPEAKGHTEAPEEYDGGDDNGQKSNKGLVITAIVLLLAIIAVVIYIAVRFFMPASNKSNKADSTTASTAQTVASTTTEAMEISCTGLQLNETTVELLEAGDAWLLAVTPVPENTTDVIRYSSSDTSIATVNGEGKVTAVAAGEATITITCGSATAEVKVTCGGAEATSEATDASEETTAPTTAETTAETVDPDATYTVYFYGEWREDNDITLATGESVEVTLEDEDGNEASVTWKAEEDGIVTIDGGTFTGNAPGIAYISTTYGGVKYEIIVRVY